jgi:predicted DNA-binding ribbon-helix-helix protein
MSCHKEIPVGPIAEPGLAIGDAADVSDKDLANLADAANSSTNIASALRAGCLGYYKVLINPTYKIGSWIKLHEKTKRSRPIAVDLYAKTQSSC